MADLAKVMGLDVLAGAPTKEFFVPATGAENGTPDTRCGEYAVIRLDASLEQAYTTFHVPHDFSSITEAVYVVIARDTDAAANWWIYSNYASDGEAYNTHAESDEATTYNVTNNQIFEVDISTILTALAADDYVGVRIKQSSGGHNLDVLGIRFKYS